jgi:hypothetical protein
MWLPVPQLVDVFPDAVFDPANSEPPVRGSRPVVRLPFVTVCRQILHCGRETNPFSKMVLECLAHLWRWSKYGFAESSVKVADIQSLTVTLAFLK